MPRNVQAQAEALLVRLGNKRGISHISQKKPIEATYLPMRDTIWRSSSDTGYAFAAYPGERSVSFQLGIASFLPWII
jgi:hypothetical protein